MLKHIERVLKKYKETHNLKEVYTTAEAAKLAGISRQTLQMWIATGRIKAPEVLRPSRLRLWTSEDLAQLKEVKQKTFGKKPGRKPRRQEGTESGAVSANT